MSDTSHYQSSAGLAVTTPGQTVPVAVVPAQATSDEMLIDLWVHGRSPHTVRAYRADIRRFRDFTGKPLAQTGLVDLQQFADALNNSGLAAISRNRVIVAVKSLFAFGHGLGYFPFDVGKPVRIKAVRDTLAERIVPEAAVQRILALERHPRNAVLLLVAYASGARVSELSGLRWADCIQHPDGSGQVTLFGKGGKTRAVRLPQSVMKSLMALRGDGANENSPVFVSRRRRALSSPQILRVVKAAAARAGVKGNVVVHSFRHAHASHSLDRGAPISLVQATLGHASVATTGRYLHARPDASSATYLPL
jgi:integrase/recombinase XerD